MIARQTRQCCSTIPGQNDDLAAFTVQKRLPEQRQQSSWTQELHVLEWPVLGLCKRKSAALGRASLHIIIIIDHSSAYLRHNCVHRRQIRQSTVKFAQRVWPLRKLFGLFPQDVGCQRPGQLLQPCNATVVDCALWVKEPHALRRWLAGIKVEPQGSKANRRKGHTNIIRHTDGHT